MKAFVFPGQGAQFTGMGKDLYENNAEARTMMDKANEILGFDLTGIMFEGDAEALKEIEDALYGTESVEPKILLPDEIKAICDKHIGG